MSADVMEDQPLQKKQKLASSVSMDDDLDGFSELNQLEDIKSQNASVMNGGIGGSHQSQPMQQMHMTSQQQQQSASKQQQPGAGQMFHGVSGQQSQQQPPQHQQQQQPSAQQPPQQQTGQSAPQPSSSVLQELLMSNTHSTASSMNSPRPSYTSFNTRSPMSNNVAQQNITPPSNMAMHGSQQPRIMRQHAAAVAASNNQQPVYDSAGGMGPPAGPVGPTGGPPYHMMSGQPPQGGGPPYSALSGPFNPQQHQQQMHMRQLYGQQGGSAVRGGPGSVPGQQMPPHAGSPMNRATPNAMIVNGGGPTPQGRQLRPPYSSRDIVMSGGQPQPRSMMMQQVPGGVMPAAYDQYSGHVMGNGPSGGPHRQSGMPPDGYMQAGSSGGSGGPVGQMMPGHMQQPNTSQPGMRGFPPSANGPNGPPSGMINAQMAGHRQAGGYVGIPPSSIPSQMMSHGMDNSMIGTQGNIHQMSSQGMMMNGPSHMGPGGSQQPPPQQVKGMMSAMGQPGPQQSLAPSPGTMGGGMPGSQHPTGMMQQPSMMNGPGSMRGPGGVLPVGMGGRSGPPGSAGPPSSQQSQDPEKRKLIQQQLVLLLHAHKCQQREKQDPANRDPANTCSVPYCTLMKSVLEHMTSCGNGRQCEYQHCASSRQIITHWKNCSKDDCPVCKPVKNFNSSGERRQDMMGGSMNLLGTPHAMSVGSADLGVPFTSPPPSSSSSNAAVNNLLNDYTPNIKSNPFQSANPPNKIGQPNSIPPIQPNQGQDAGFGQFPPPEPPAQPKEWHDSITQDLRNHLVGKLVKAIFPSPDPAVIHDQRIKDLISYARKVEKDMFEQAADKEAYYHLLAEKIYKIQKELQEKKNRRLNEQNQNVGGGPMDTGLADFPPARHVMGGGPSDFGPMGHTGPGGMASGDFPGGSVGSNGAGMMNAGVAGGMLMKDVKAEPMIHHSAQQQASGSVALSSAMGGMKDVKIEALGHSHHQPMLSSVASGVNGLSASDSMTSIASTSLNFVPTVASGSSHALMKMKSEEKCMAIASISGESMKSELIDEPTASKAMVPKTDAAQPAPVEEDLPVDEKVFSPNELRNYLKPVHQKVWDPDEAAPFRYPVDAEQLNIPDYYKIIMNPMDLSTIDKKLNNGDYKNPWEFCDDMYLMFENAWLYNRKNSKVYKCCTKLSELFIAEINPVMREMGYCCGQKLSFTPLALFCYGQSACVIARDQPYHLYESNSNNYGVVVNDRLIYCTKCFEALPEEGINLNENPNEAPNMAPKQNFKLLKNDQIDMEPFEKCKVCIRQWHRICANYSKKIFTEGFICDTCRTAKGRPKPENRFTAKRLPHCQLSRFIEERVNKFIERRCEPGAREKYEVVIRVLCSTDKEVEVKPMMKQKYCSENFPERFPYRTKAVFAFEVVDGVEVCFFGLHVQEYGSSCAPPNQRRVYIAYLDSVYFFQPKHLRTDIYHEILLGYLSYVKKLGYTMAHIWACPPSEGDDYIFHCHPPEQKIPKQKRLQEWYKKMLDKGRDEDTVYEYKDIFKQAKDDDLQTPMTLPYFEGDFWPNVVEDCIRDAEKEEHERKKHEESLVDEEDDDVFQTDDSRPKKNNNKSSNSKKKNNLKKSSQKSKKKSGPGTGNQITDKLFNVLEKHKEVFFTIRLVSPNVELKVKATSINDPDPLMASELMDGRDTFLNKAREEHWEFSSLRRAKWSTINFCHALHTLEQEKEIVTCNLCNNAAAEYHCNTCEDYDLCQQCYSAGTDHPHKLDKVQNDAKTTSSGSDSSVNDRNESVKRCISSLVHSCQCRDANCRRLTCHKMKRVVQHTRVCRKRQQTNCPVCKQLIALCCYHAKHCNQASCLVPFCTNIRQKLQEQKRSQTRRADKMMRRRMEMLHTNTSASTSSNNSHQAADNGAVGDRQPPSSSSSMNGMQKPAGGGGASIMTHQQPLPSPQHHPSAHPHHGGGGYQPQHHHPSQQSQHHGGAAHSHAGIMMAGDQSPINNGQPGGGMSIHQQQPQQHMGGGNASMMHGSGGMGNGAMMSQMGHYQSPGGPMTQHQMGGPMTPQQQQMRNAQMMQGHIGMNTQQRMAGAQQPTQMMGGPINPPPYGGRGGGMVNSPAGPYSNQAPGGPGSIPPHQQQQTSMRMTQQQMQRSMQSPQQQQQRHLQRPQQMPPQQQQQPVHRLSETQIHQITERLKNADSTEKRAAVFTDLKKTPHLFAAVLKLNDGFINELCQQYMQEQQNWVPPQYSQQQQIQMGGGPPPYNNNNNNSGHQQQESQQQQQPQWSSVKFSQ